MTQLPSQIVTQMQQTASWKVGFSHWYDWGQNADWTSDGRPDENKADNCLMESLAECIKFLTHVELPADYIKDVLYGDGYTGFTYFRDAVRFLADYCDLPGYEWSHPTMGDTLWEVWNALKSGHPCIGLFQYGGISGGTPHCMPYLYLDTGKVIVSDPWTAQRRTFTYSEHNNWSLLAGMTIPHARFI